MRDLVSKEFRGSNPLPRTIGREGQNGLLSGLPYVGRPAFVRTN